jgi:predicted O-methyltransferase YrrM
VQAGSLVRVPILNRLHLGLVTEVNAIPDCPPEKLKAVGGVMHQFPALTPDLLELARCVARAPRAADAPPLLEVGTRSGGSALLMLRVLQMLYRSDGRPPMVLTVDPYGARPYEGAPFVYHERHYRAMKRNLAGYANHVHYMMDSELFVRELAHLYLWVDGVKRPLNRFTLIYLDGRHDPDIVWFEIERLLPAVIPGGFLIVDDTDWFGGAIRRQLEAAAPQFGVHVRHNGKQSVVQV